MSEYIFIGIDCGKKGAISILKENEDPIIYEMPLITEKNKQNKKKTSYDLKKIISFFTDFKDKNVIYTLEKQSLRLGEGAVSAMTIGEGIGSLKGIGFALGFDVKIVSPQTWKKSYPELQSDLFNSMKDKQKEINKKTRELNKQIKNMKDKDKKKKIKDEISNLKKESQKLGRDIKYEAKSQARVLASIKFPNLADRFSRVKDDGPAESLLIALYSKNNLNNKDLEESE